ncbi:MAG: PAS domain-containing protein [Planctomycetota bacterium]|nr:PAS domain-containing protein [Planctomycetota bacterium]
MDVRQLLEVLGPEGILIVDKEARILYVSKLAAGILGLGRNALKGRCYDAAGLPMTDGGGRPLPGPQSPFRRVVDARKSVRDMRHGFVRPDGSRVLLHVNGSPRTDRQGRLTGAVFALRDVSEQASMEAQLAQLQKMDAFGRLAAGIVHDFNNQLTVINGYCELLLKDMADGAASKREIGHILAAGKRSAALTSRLLGFSRKRAPDPQPTFLDEVVRDLAKPLARVIGEDIRLYRPSSILRSTRATPSRAAGCLV